MMPLHHSTTTQVPVTTFNTLNHVLDLPVGDFGSLTWDKQAISTYLSGWMIFLVDYYRLGQLAVWQSTRRRT